MEKNVLFLINGLGIQTRDSYDIELNKCMPNLTKYVNEDLFATMNSNTYDYKEGYASLSTGSKLPVTFLKIEKETELDKEVVNDTLTSMSSKITGKIHIFCYLEDARTYYHIKSYIKTIYKNNPKQIYIHIILSQKVLSAYGDVNNFITKVNYDLSSYAKVGLVFGEDIFNGTGIKELTRVFYTEIAEIWKEIDIKIKSLINNKIQPCLCKPFIVNKGIKLENNDTILFFNYSNKNLTNQLTNLMFNPVKREQVNFQLYSLYPVVSNLKVDYLHTYNASDVSLLNNLKLINSNCLVLSLKEQMNYINYYLNGYQGVVNKEISFGVLDDDCNKIEAYIKNTNYNLYIISYDVGNTTDYLQFIESLSKIDIVLGNVYNLCKSNKYPLYIASLYGINKKLYENKISRYINFSLKLPLILVNDKYPSTNYLIKDGNVYMLMETILKSIDPKFIGDSLIIKKTKLFNIFKRK